MSVISLEEVLGLSTGGLSDIHQDAANDGSMVGLDDALAWCMGDEASEEAPARTMHIGKHHPVLQRERARVGWVKRKSQRLDTDGAADLHRLHINAHQAVRCCDLLPGEGSGDAGYCKAIHGRGMYQVFTPRAFLRVAFASPFESAVETAQKFYSSATGRPASHSHIKDVKMCAAQLLRDQTVQRTRDIFWPSSRCEYVVQSLCFDEASFKVAAMGEKPMESPCLAATCALLTKKTNGGSEFVNLHSPLVVMQNKHPHFIFVLRMLSTFQVCEFQVFVFLSVFVNVSIVQIEASYDDVRWS